MILKKINFKQPKYILPAILFPLLVLLGYFVIDLFNFEVAESDNGLETTDYFNAKLPQVSIRGDGIGGKRENVENEFSHITDFTAIQQAGEEEMEDKEEYSSRYSAEDIAMLEQNEYQTQQEMERLKKLQKEYEESLAPAELYGEEDIVAANKKRQEESMDELQQALAELVGKNNVASLSTNNDTPTEDDGNTTSIVDSTADVHAAVTASESHAVTEINPELPPEVAVKKHTEHSAYFNTLTENDRQPGMIKAIIDEEIKAVDGSRVRLRLLDDIEIEGTVVKKGTYLYATMSGFGSQRVKGSVSSILVEDRLIKISLNIYDTDGLEGLYVPKSQFRETTKDIMSQALSSPMQVSTGSYQNQMATWGMNALQNTATRLSSAISQNIRKNNAKLKYGTFVYLVNGRQ